jgi:hypothetical protein
LNNGNYPPPPHWNRRAIQPNHVKFRTCSALAPKWTPPINESAELTQGALKLIQYSERLIRKFSLRLALIQYSEGLRCWTCLPVYKLIFTCKEMWRLNL